ncbi:MAG: ABC transporter substrate-binding protein [Hydrotalea sp.]|nr:ABC transporter substrate-binding protein [Hydrotalea sp.]
MALRVSVSAYKKRVDRLVGWLACGAFTLFSSLPTESLAKAGQVNIIAWPGYMERGQNNKDFDWLTQFEKDTNCKVNVKISSSSDEMVTLMNQGGFDLVTASGDASVRMIRAGVVQPIDISKITAWKTIDKRLENQPWDTVKQNGTMVHYGVPFMWGPIVLLYNKKVFKTPPTSWSVVFDEQTLPDGKSNKGRVSAYISPIYLADVALYVKKRHPELKIDNPYYLTEKQYQATLAQARAQRKIIGHYWGNPMTQIDDFANEGTVASSSWQFQVNLLQRGKKSAEFDYTIPREGSTGWVDTTMLHSKSKNVDCAYAWLNHSISPKLQGDLAAWFGAVPAVPAACRGNKLLGEDGCRRNGFYQFKNIVLTTTPVQDCGKPEPCVPYSRWVHDYQDILGR